MGALSIIKMNNGAADLDHLAEIATSTAHLATDRLGNTKKTVAGVVAAAATAASVALSAIGYEVPLPYVAGIALSRATQTVEFEGQSYAPAMSSLPFVTSGMFEVSKFRLIQGLVRSDLAMPSGAGIAGFSPTEKYGVGSLGLQAQQFLHLVSFMTDEQIADAADAAVSNREPIFDLTLNWKLALEVAKQLDKKLYGGRLLIGVSGPAVSECPGIVFDRVGYSSGLWAKGSGYTVLTVRGRVSALDITVKGSGNKVNGILLENVVCSSTGLVRVTDLSGYGVKCSDVWDSLIGPISIERCGGEIYAGQVGGKDTTNMTVFQRWQIENCGGRVFDVHPNTLCCVFLSTHSEQAKGIPGVTTWRLGGNGCVWIAPRVDASGGNTNDASIVFLGANTKFESARVEGNISIAMEAYSGSTLSFNDPYFLGVAFVTPRQVGTINFFGGYVSRLYTGAIKFRVYGTVLSEVAMGAANFEPRHTIFNGCDISSLTSLDTTSAATFHGCRITGGTLLGNTVLIDTSVTFQSALTLSYGAVRLSNSQLICPSLTVNSGYIDLANGSTVQGDLTITGQPGSYCDLSSYVTGTVTGWSRPFYPTYRPGGRFSNSEYSKNLSMAPGAPTGWFYAAGAWRVAGILGA